MEMINDEGWVKLHRRIGRSAVFQNEGLLKVWIWCLIRANHKEEWVPISTGRGTTQVPVHRGQFIFGRKSAAKALKMDESTVYKRMQKLESMENLNIQSNTHYSLVTILNYELYQGYQNDEVTGKVTPKEQPSNTNKNDKNEKNNIGSSPKKTGDPRVKAFFDFWKEAFLHKTGQEYVFSFGKEGRLVKDLLEVHNLETLQDTVQAFFRNEEAQRRGYDIGTFKSMFNRIVATKAMDPLEQAKRESRDRANW